VIKLDGVAPAISYGIVFDIKADAAVIPRDLTRRISNDDVLTNDIAGSPGCYQEPVRISANAVALNQIAGAGSDKTHAEIIVRCDRRCRSGAGGSGTYGAVPAKLIFPNMIVMAADEAVAAAGRDTRIEAVSDGNIPFDIAVRHTIQKESAETIMAGRDILQRDSRADASRPWHEDSMATRVLNHARSQNLHIRLVIGANTSTVAARPGGANLWD
jgi:hypothetical protein